MRIDLNADVGEGGIFDEQLLQIVSSANISCGAHAGNRETITAAIQWAIQNNVSIGAHPSYPDRAGFGRHAMHLSTVELRKSIHEQLELVQDLTMANGGTLVHVKPHGALYNQAAVDLELATDLVDIVKEFNKQLNIVALAGSVLLQVAEKQGMRVKAEAFTDRRYSADGTLVPRTDSRAMIHDTQQAITQSLQLLLSGTITSLHGDTVHLHADTLCLHGDNPQALVFAQQLRKAFEQAGITISAQL